MKLRGASGMDYEVDLLQGERQGGRVLAELWQGDQHLVLKIDDNQASEAERRRVQVGIRQELRRMLRLQAIPGMERLMVPIVDHGEHRGRPFYLMPHMPLRLPAWMGDGPGLQERLARARALAELLQQLQSLGSEAGLRLSHRDIKPDNLYIDGPGLRLGDWGASRLGEEDEPASGEYSERYAPLDQALGLEDTAPPASWDVYAVAAVVVELLTGDPPRSIAHNRLYTRSAGGEDRELHRLARTDKMLSLHTRDLEELERKMVEGLPEGKGRERLARRMLDELRPPLRKALHPDPRFRSTEPAALLLALERCGALMARPPREERWALGAGLGLAALGLLALGEWPPRREAVLELEGLPEWAELELRGLPPGQAHRWQELRPGPSGEARRRLVLPGLTVGQQLQLELVGGLSGAAEDLRCGFRAELPVAVGLGLGDLDIEAPDLSPPPCPSAGLPLSLIPAGPVWVGPLRWGADEEASWETANTDEGEGQELQLEQGLLLAQIEVSQALWGRVAARSPSLPPEPWSRADQAGNSCTLSLPAGRAEAAPGSLPAHCISFCEALAFANALSSQDGLQPAYSGLEGCAEGRPPERQPGADGWRLPTALEWTRAARGARHHLYAGLAPNRRLNLPIAAAPAPLHPVCAVANVRGAEWGLGSDTFPCSDGSRGPSPVASFSPNAHGLYDMTGNVMEWVWDLYLAPPAEQDLLLEDRCTAERGCRQLRGGSWASDPDHARISNIAASPPGEPVIGAGLRLARDIPLPMRSPP